MKKKNTEEKWKYKFLTKDEFTKMKTQSNESLLLELHSQNKAIAIVKKERKDDGSLKELSKKIKKHRDEDQDLTQAKEDVKDLKKKVDEKIEDLIEEKKGKTAKYSEREKAHREKTQAISIILDGRDLKK